MHIDQVMDFDRVYSLEPVEIDENYDETENNTQRPEVILADETEFFFGASNSNQIAQVIEEFIPEILAYSDELLFTVILSFDSKGKATLSVPSEEVSKEFSLSDFSFRDRSFTFALYRVKSDRFILRLFSKFYSQE